MKENNEEFVERIIKFSPYGALSQVFILAALDSYATSIISSGPIEDDFINPQAWLGTANWIKDQVDKHLA